MALATLRGETADDGARVREILATVKPLAAEYYQLTGEPLGVTGEVAEYVAAEILGLTLVPARTVGYDAVRGTERIQIKGRSYGAKAKPGQRMSRIKLEAPCDTVLLSRSAGQCDAGGSGDVGGDVRVSLRVPEATQFQSEGARGVECFGVQASGDREACISV